MAQKNDWLDGLDGFAKRAFAEKRAIEVLGEDEPYISWFIYTLPNGRFVPVVIKRGDGWLNMNYMASKGLAIMN